MNKVAKKLYRLMDYQKFEDNRHLGNVLESSSKCELSSSQLLAAVGGVDKTKTKRLKKTSSKK